MTTYTEGTSRIDALVAAAQRRREEQERREQEELQVKLDMHREEENRKFAHAVQTIFGSENAVDELGMVIVGPGNFRDHSEGMIFYKGRTYMLRHNPSEYKHDYAPGRWWWERLNADEQVVFTSCYVSDYKTGRTEIGDELLVNLEEISGLPDHLRISSPEDF